MNLIPWRNRNQQMDDANTTDLLRAFERRLDRFFGDNMFDLAGEMMEWPRGATPAIDIADNGKEITIDVDAPGMKADEFDVNVSGDLLTVSGQSSAESEEKEQGWYRRERRHGSFQRSVRLPAPIDPKSVSAEYKDGVLKVRCVKPAGMQPKHIDVKGD